MSGVLSRLTKLGMAFETPGSQGTWVAPAISIPFNTAKFSDAITPLRDESVRANDVVLQGLQQGPWSTTWDLETNFYPDLAGYFFKALIGPDTVTAGVSTALASNCAAGATSLTVSAALVTTPNIIQISDATGANLEWLAVTGSGTTLTVTTPGGTKFQHIAAGGSVISLSTHTFKQNRTFSTQWPSVSFTTDDGSEQLGWPGQVMSELGITIDPMGFVGLAPKFTGWPSTAEATFSYAASVSQPAAGWEWTVTNAGASSTRGVTMNITMKRAIDVIQGSDGTQGPREVFAGALESDGTYKAIFENATDKNLFIQNNQLPTVHTITKPVPMGGESVAITMSQSGYTLGDVDLSPNYMQLDMNLSGIGNTTDAGVTAVVLKNYRVSAY